MLVTIGDLVEDIVVLLGGPVNLASDTTVVVSRRRGGSAANMASTAARLGHRVRFVGQVGDDAVGRDLVRALTADGVDVVAHHGGRTGTIVCLVDDRGERTMLADRGACVELSPADPSWIDGAHTLHVPFYSFAVEPLATTALQLVDHAHRQGVRVSIDASSVGVLDDLGEERVRRILTTSSPDVLLCNADEAAFLGDTARPDAIGGGTVVVKRGAGPASALTNDGAITTVAALDIGAVDDTTGAGDAFAAGLLVALSLGDDIGAALAAGHASAASLLSSAR